MKYLEHLKTKRRIKLLNSYNHDIVGFIPGSVIGSRKLVDCLVVAKDVVRHNELMKWIQGEVFGLYTSDLVNFVRVDNFKPMRLEHSWLLSDAYAGQGFGFTNEERIEELCILKCSPVNNFGLIKEYAKWHHLKK